ncbi:hypothetical protein [Emticicia sp. SJ17W-69]|uniref:hypothetical protein n=1 Tax=Emticicia sp. SJ17W-69 TaxID=3421657 RepID=UPI003EBA6CBE
MKTTCIFIALSMFYFSAFCQEIDENGRTPAQQKAVSTIISTPAVYLQEDPTVKSASMFTMKFSLPEGKTTGEIIVFHPKIDQELKKISLMQRQGAVQISTKDLPNGAVIGLYADGILLETQRVKL